MTRIVVVPSPPALLPEYAGHEDPLVDVRRLAADAVGWLVAPGTPSVVVLATSPAGGRVARHLLAGAGFTGTVADAPGPGVAVLVVADGSARRGERAPGHLDPRSFDFDSLITRALETGDPRALRDLDVGLGRELLADGVPSLVRLGELVADVSFASLDYSGDPYGVQYWVARWLATLVSEGGLEVPGPPSTCRLKPGEGPV